MLDVEKKKKICYLVLLILKGKNKLIKSQLYQDVFADFLINNNYNKTFLEFGATNGMIYQYIFS